MAGVSCSAETRTKSDVHRSLEDESFKRYQEKISVIDFFDPYAVDLTEMSGDADDLPGLTRRPIRRS
jgi:hypothetical protein